MRKARGRSDLSIRKDEIAILKFEKFFKFADLGSFSKEQALTFKGHLVASGLNITTVVSTLKSIQSLLIWLSGQPGFIRRVRQEDVEYLNLPTKDRRSIQQPYSRVTPTLSEFVSVVASMPTTTLIERRDQALMALMGTTGIRAGAAVTLRLKHLDPKRKYLRQDPREVATKFSKHIDTFLLPISEKLRSIILVWHASLINELGFGPNDPLFPKTVFKKGKDAGFSRRVIVNEFWSDAQLVGKIFRTAFASAGKPICSPHSVRNMIVKLIYSMGLSLAQAKAWSQGLGHQSAHTTLMSYGQLSVDEQEHLVLGSTDQVTAHKPTQADIDELFKLLTARLKAEEGSHEEGSQ